MAKQRLDNRFPRSITIGVIACSVAPFLLMSLGVDFSSSAISLGAIGSDRPISTDTVNALHRALAGSFTHTILEWSAFCAAIFTVFLAFTHYRISRDITTPIIAVALFCAGAMDAFHTLAADRLIEAVADNRDLAPFTWALCRTFNVLIVLAGVGVILWRRKTVARVGGSSAFVAIVSLAFGALAYATIHITATTSSLPQTTFPDALITRPWDLGPLIMFALAGLFIYPRLHRRSPSLFTYSLIIAVIPGIMTQAHMAFGSQALFDSHFNVAHFLKTVGYLVPIVGLSLDYVQTFRAKHRAVSLLESEVARREKIERNLVDLAERLASSESKSRQRLGQLTGILESSTEALIFTSDREGRFEIVNAGASRLLGLDAHELIATRTVTEFIKPEEPISIDRGNSESCPVESNCQTSHDRFKQLTALARVGISDRKERILRLPDGTERPIDMTVTGISSQENSSGEFTSFLFFGVDIGEVRETQAILLRSGEEAAGAQKEALQLAQESEKRRLELEETLARLELIEMELRSSQERVSEVTSTIDQVIWSMDVSTQMFTYISEAADRILGYSPDRLITAPALLETSIHDEDRELYFKMLERLSRGRKVTFEFRLVDQENAIKWIKVAASPLLDISGKVNRFTGSFSDVTSFKLATDALQASEARIRAIVENIADGFIIVDHRGIVESFNPSAEVIFGYHADEVVGSHVSTLLSPESVKELGGLFKNYLETGEDEYLARIRSATGLRKNGSTAPLELAVRPVQVGSHVIFAGVVRDISERLAQQDYMAKAEKNAAIGTLAAGVAHEFKNCLGGILGNATLAQDFIDDQTVVSESLIQIVESSEKANKIALSLLSYSLSSDNLKKSADPVQCARDAITLLAGDLRKKAITVRIKEGTEALQAPISQSDLQQALMNISLNAIQASPDKSEIVVKVSRQQETIRIEIVDHGIGMDTGEVKRAFDPFYSNKGVWGSDAEKGTGLGLTSAKNLVESASGSIELKSAEGVGTTAVITLPLVKDENSLSGSRIKRPFAQSGHLLLHISGSTVSGSLAKMQEEMDVITSVIEDRDSLIQALNPAVDTVVLDGMSSGKIEFLRMFEYLRNNHPDLRIIVVVDPAFDHYIADYVSAADAVIRTPLTSAKLAATLGLATNNLSA